MDIFGVFLLLNYIIENINGDVCVLDLFWRVLIVMDKFNEEWFFYGEKKEVWFLLNVVVIDICGYIVVCDGYENMVYFLDFDG